MELADKIKQTIRDVADYPKPGVIFKDITPVLASPALMREISAQLVEQLRTSKPDAIAAVEARGFIFGSILANALGCRFIPIRKAGKLPYHKLTKRYTLEYGDACIEMHVDAVQKGWRVLVHDDLLATGGTAGATAELIQSAGGILAGFSFLVNLEFLPGEKNLTERFGVRPHYLVSYS
jgi:adenine phosphoribosyltransferase